MTFLSANLVLEANIVSEFIIVLLLEIVALVCN